MKSMKKSNEEKPLLMKVPNKFNITISRIGTDVVIVGLKKIEDDDALRLGFTVCDQMAKAWVHPKDQYKYMYMLACKILSYLDGWTEEVLLEDIKKNAKNWTITSTRDKQ